MKRCSYCGAEYPDDATECAVDKTPFVADTTSTPQILSRTVESGLKLALLNGFGILLILLALFFAIGRLYAEHRMPPRQISNYIRFDVFTSTTPAPFIVLAAAVPIFFVCRARSRERRYGIISAIVIILIAGVLSLLTKIIPTMMMMWCLPALLFGRDSDSSFGFYFGAVLQIVIGAWLVIWFHPCRSSDKKDAT